MIAWIRARLLWLRQKLVGWKITTTALLIALASLAEVAPGIRDVISPGLYKCLMILASLAIVVFRAYSFAPVGYRQAPAPPPGPARTPSLPGGV